VIVWIVATILLVLVWLAVRTPWGRVLRAIREDEDAAASLGKNVPAYKLQVLALGSGLAGIAGLLAGAFSMAAGEYISMQSQRELFERQIALERAELEAMPEEEQAEMAALYRAKGFPPDEAEAIAARLFENPERALDTLIREELGLDPSELGSPVGAAGGSFVAFALGAAVPVIPYLLASGSAAFVASIVLSLVALFLVGAAVSLLTGRGFLFSGVRQVLIGAAAAVVTFAVGSLIGVAAA